MGGNRGLVPGCSGSLWKTRQREAAQSDARVTGLSELLFVSSSPALRCSVSALSDR